MIRYEPTGKNLVSAFCGNLGPISGASPRDSACSTNFNPNRSAAAGLSRAIYFTICSRSFLPRAEKITCQAMSGQLRGVDPRCKSALHQCRARLYRVIRLILCSLLRLKHRTRIVERVILIPKRPAQQLADVQSLVRFVRCSQSRIYCTAGSSAIVAMAAKSYLTVAPGLWRPGYLLCPAPASGFPLRYP
jgi:hypothetical protein